MMILVQTDEKGFHRLHGMAPLPKAVRMSSPGRDNSPQ
jgi:hypothetical protein